MSVTVARGFGIPTRLAIVVLRARPQTYSGAASGELVAGLAGLAGDSTACDDGAFDDAAPI